MKATRSCFSAFDSFVPRTTLKNSTVSSSVSSRPSCRYGGVSFLQLDAEGRLSDAAAQRGLVEVQLFGDCDDVLQIPEAETDDRVFHCCPLPGPCIADARREENRG